jgi:TRAP-type transport system small permease protein
MPAGPYPGAGGAFGPTPSRQAAVIRFLERGLGLVAAAGLFAMMTLTFADVFARKFLGFSIRGSLEMTELLMLAVIFMGLPLASLKGEHVFFDLLDHLLPEHLRRVQAVVSNLICVAILVGATWLVWQRAGRTASMGDITAQLTIPIAPFHYATAVLLALTALMHCYIIFVPPRRHVIPGTEP